MTTQSDIEREAQLNQKEQRLTKWEKELARREAQLLDNLTMQAIVIVLLRKAYANKKMNAADRNEIQHAQKLFEGDDYRPREKLAHILRETEIDRELKRKRPD